MVSNCQLKRNHFKVFLFCLIFCCAVTFTGTIFRLQFKIFEGTGFADNDFAAYLHDTVENKPLNHGNKSVFKTDDISPELNAAIKSMPSQVSKVAPKSAQNSKKSAKNPKKLTITKPEKQESYESRKNYSSNATTELSEFTHHEGVVIVTKVHGPHQLGLFKQSMCLLHQAYNKKLKYDIILFTTVPIIGNDTSLVAIRKIISPVKLDVIVDNDGIVNEINKLSPRRRQNFLERCNATSPEDITWDSECYEENVGMGRIGYNWQAEFRSWHIWNHKALRQYRYMMWIDTDAFCTQVWDRDPVAIAMKKRMVIYFDNYPQGRSKAAQPRVKEAFGKYLCSARKSESGSMYSSTGDDCSGAQLWTIHGFYHITDLDFYRQKQVINWAEIMIGDCFLCRKFDDQLAVTVPPAMLAPERAWDMYKSGVQLKIFHNFLIDGKRKYRVGGFLDFWKKNGESQFPEAWNKCEITEGS